jgi:hypothetical protein
LLSQIPKQLIQRLRSLAQTAQPKVGRALLNGRLPFVPEDFGFQTLVTEVPRFHHYYSNDSSPHEESKNQQRKQHGWERHESEQPNADGPKSARHASLTQTLVRGFQ